MSRARKKRAVTRPSEPDVRRAVSARVPDLVAQNWTVGLLTKVHQEILVEGESTFDRVHFYLKHPPASPEMEEGWIGEKIQNKYITITGLGILISSDGHINTEIA